MSILNPLITPPHRRLCEVTPQLYLCAELPEGWEDAHRTLEEWAAAGITDIVDVRSEGDDRALVARRRPSFRYHHHPSDDDGRQRPDEWFDAGTATLQRILDDTSRKAVVHCAMGVNRGPSLAFAAMITNGWDPVDALNAIRRARPVAVVFYAEDAVRWWHCGDMDVAEQYVAEVHQWFIENIQGADWIVRRLASPSS